MSNTYSLAPAIGAEINYVIPTIAPYYVDGLSVSIVATAKSWCSAQIGVSTPLVMGVDWEPSLRFASATAELGAPVYYCVSFTDTALAGTVTITGTAADISYTLTGSQITALQSSAVDPLTTTYEAFFGITIPYPSTTLSYNTTNPKYAKDVVTSLNTINATLASSTGMSSVFNFNIHIGNTSNPHITTSKILGLDAIPNWTAGTATDMVNKNTNAFITPAAITAGIGSVILQATPTIPGSFKLNLGSTAGDDSNAVKALTAVGLVNMITSGTANAINAYFNKPRTAVRFSPFPITYPARWPSGTGTYYLRFADLVAAVEASTHMPNLMNSDILGTIWFPNGVTPPSLALG